jgi:PAS domain S-box-containing protein
MESTSEIKRLQSCLNDLITVLALPAIWSGGESPHILDTLLDSLVTMLRLDFAYARLNPSDGPRSEAVRLADRRGPSVQSQPFGLALDRWLSGDQNGSRLVVPHPVQDFEVSIVSFSLGLQQQGDILVAGSQRADFPTEIERLLLRVAANQAGIGLQEARRSGDQKRIADMLEQQVAERTRRLTALNEQLRHSEAYLAEAQRLSHTGSFGWRPSTDEIIWSEETFRIFDYDRTTVPSVGLVLKRIHPEDLAFVQQTIERASQDGKDFELEHRLLMPNGSVKNLHVVARASSNESGNVEFIGAVMDITARKRAEEALRRSEGYLARAQSLTQSGSWAWNVRTDARFWSQETFRIFEYDPEVIKPTWSDILERTHPEDRAAMEQQAKIETTRKEDSEFDWRIVLPGGRIKHIRSIAHPVLDESGEVTEIVGTLMDVTERKRAEALRDGESRILEMIARDAPLEEILVKLVRVVEAQFAGLLCSVLLLDEDGQHVRHGAAPSLPEPYTKAIDGLPIGPKAGSCGTAMYRREPVVVTDILEDPLWEPYRAVAEPYGLRACWSTPILAHSGKVLGSFAMYYREPRSPNPAETRALEMATHLAGIAIERKLTHEQLQRSEAYLAEAQRLSHTGSWAFNARAPVYWSEENFRIWGFNPQKGLPDRETVLQRIHPEDRDRVVEYVLKKVMRERGDYTVEFRIVLPDGGVRYIHGIGHPVFSASGELVEIVGTNVDVTERKRAEEERERLRQTQADLTHMNRVTTMGELTASLAHEVNQPIAAAVTDANTCLRWLKRDQPDVEEASQAASRIVKDVTRAAEIISRVRLLFKKGTPQRALVEVNEIIQEMIVILRSEATRYSISIRTELADLPPVMGDRVQLQQVLMNLMINGIDAMRDVDGTRELVIRSKQAEDGQLMISVSDTGVGLPPKLSEQIFNAFFTTKLQGTGMGLRISRSIVESHGGRLWAAGNAQRGASFYVTLPTQAEAA